MGAMAVLWSFLGVLKHLLAPPLRCPCLLRLKNNNSASVLGVPADTVGGTGTPWHTRGYAPGSLRCGRTYERRGNRQNS